MVKGVPGAGARIPLRGGPMTRDYGKLNKPHFYHLTY